MSGPTLPQKLAYMHNFALRDDVGYHSSHYWKMVGVGIQLVAWGGNRQTFNRLFNWDELDTLSKAHIEGAIRMTFEQVRKSDKQAMDANAVRPPNKERQIPVDPVPPQEIGIFG